MPTEKMRGELSNPTPFALESNYMNDLWSFDISEFTWQEEKLQGEYPEKRSNHSAVYLKDNNQ